MSIRQREAGQERWTPVCGGKRAIVALGVFIGAESWERWVFDRKLESSLG